MRGRSLWEALQRHFSTPGSTWTLVEDVKRCEKDLSLPRGRIKVGIASKQCLKSMC